MTAFANCCNWRFSSLASIIDSYKKSPDTAQFVRTLKNYTVEQAQEKIKRPWWPWSDEWWEDLKGIGEKAAELLASTAWTEVSALTGHNYDPLKTFWSDFWGDFYFLLKHERGGK